MLTALTATLASNPPPELPGFLNVVGSYLQHFGYWAVLLLVMIEDFGVPVPGETILIAAAVFAGAGRLNVVAVGVVAFVAAVIGDNIGFALGHFGGRALALRWGRYVGLNAERLDKVEDFFNRHGGKIIVVARFIEGLRQANGIVAGLTGMHWRRFVVFNALGAALWVGTWVSIGYFAGRHITTIYNDITRYSYYVLIAIAVLLVVYIWVLRRRRRAILGEAGGTHAARSADTAANAQATGSVNAADGAQATDGAQAADSAQVPDGTMPTDGATVRDSAGTQGGAGIQDDAGTQDSVGPQDGAGIQESAGIQNGTGAQDSANTQSS